MTISTKEFKRNFEKYEELAMNRRIVILDEETGVKFTFKGENPMVRRFDDMKKGKCTSNKEAVSILLG